MRGQFVAKDGDLVVGIDRDLQHLIDEIGRVSKLGERFVEQGELHAEVHMPSGPPRHTRPA